MGNVPEADLAPLPVPGQGEPDEQCRHSHEGPGEVDAEDAACGVDAVPPGGPEIIVKKIMFSNFLLCGITKCLVHHTASCTEKKGVVEFTIQEIILVDFFA